MKSLTEKCYDFLEHQRKIWDTISFRSSKRLLLTGIGVFTPHCSGAETIISADARPIKKTFFVHPTKSDVEKLAWASGSEFGDSNKSTITIFSSVSYI